MISWTGEESNVSDMRTRKITWSTSCVEFVSDVEVRIMAELGVREPFGIELSDIVIDISAVSGVIVVISHRDDEVEVVSLLNPLDQFCDWSDEGN